MQEITLTDVYKKLEEVLGILKTQRVASDGGSGVLVTKKDGSVAGKFVVMTDPKPWSSGKGAFLSCKIDNGDPDVWYSVGLTYNVADRISQGFFPKKGDVIAVTGSYEEKTEETQSGPKVYRSVFAYKVNVERAGKQKQAAAPTVETQQSDATVDDDLPF